MSLLCSRADRVRVIRGGARNGRALGSEVVYDGKGADLKGLSTCLRATGSLPMRCMCHGTYAIEFWRSGNLLTTIGFHHHSSLRHSLFPFDAFLWNGRGLADWLAARGVDELLCDLERKQRESEEYKNARRRWSNAAPHCLRPVLFLSELGTCPSARLLNLAYPNPHVACRILLSWYAKGRGIWSGYPSYEELPRKLLQSYSEEAIEAVILDGLDNSEVVLGAARLLGINSDYLKTAPALRSLPQTVWDRLQTEVERTGDRENLERLIRVRTWLLEAESE